MPTPKSTTPAPGKSVAPEPAAPVPLPAFAPRKHPHLNEINTWAWLEELSARLGHPINLESVPDSEWIALTRLGFNIVWLMGMWQRSPESCRVMQNEPGNQAGYSAALPGFKPSDVIASPYAVRSYVPDERIATWESLDRVRAKLREFGMGLFLDFVGNHTALDHPWTREHPDFYVQGSKEDYAQNPSYFFPAESTQGTVYLALGKDPYFPPWKDVAQLNHFNPAMRAAQIADLRTIAAHCDGVRCDMAMLHLNDIFGGIWAHFLHGMPAPKKEFWAEVRESVPSLTLLAEAYWGTEPRLLDLGFTYAYDKDLYNAVRDYNIGEVHARLSASESDQSRRARFLENHDEQRRAAVFGNERLRAVGTLMGTLPGLRFYHQGEIEGLRIHLPIMLRMAAPVPPDKYSETFFHKILSITNEEVFHSGNWNLLEVVPEGDGTYSNLVAYEWRSEKSWKVLAINMAGEASQGRVRLGDRVSPTREYFFQDVLNEERYLRSGEELHSVGLFVRREAFQAHVFDVTLDVTRYA